MCLYRETRKEDSLTQAGMYQPQILLLSIETRSKIDISGSQPGCPEKDYGCREFLSFTHKPLLGVPPNFLFMNDVTALGGKGYR
jgi:hypothetical protein